MKNTRTIRHQNVQTYKTIVTEIDKTYIYIYIYTHYDYDVILKISMQLH